MHDYCCSRFSRFTSWTVGMGKLFFSRTSKQLHSISLSYTYHPTSLSVQDSEHTTQKSYKLLELATNYIESRTNLHPLASNTASQNLPSISAQFTPEATCLDLKKNSSLAWIFTVATYRSMELLRRNTSPQIALPASFCESALSTVAEQWWY